MADEIKPGAATSEFKLALFMLVASAVVEGAGVILSQLQAGGLDFHWIGVAVAAVGAVKSIFAFLGYSNGRAAVKVAALQADAASPK